MMRVLFVAEQCNPEWASVPLVAYNLWNALSHEVDVRLVTHERNKSALEKVRADRTVDYITESNIVKNYFATVSRLTMGKGTNWPLFHALSYPVYAEFNRKVRKYYGPAVSGGAFDIVHAFTPVLPRYPVSLVHAVRNTPFILGPVNGGLPFPDGFSDIKRKEGGIFTILRNATRLIPDYSATYRKASLILSGSQYTMQMLKARFPEIEKTIEIFHENGLAPEFFTPSKSSYGSHSTIPESQPESSEPTTDSFAAPKNNNGTLKNMPADNRGTTSFESGQRPATILFAGRLVPYKGADMLIEAFAASQSNANLIIVGEGTERHRLETLAQQYQVADRITFTGWIPQKDTALWYARADIFAFPSIREFGGAVVLEAMASGLPCIVVDHGGIGEYVNDACGIKVAPLSRQHIIQEFTKAIDTLVADTHLRKRLSYGAVDQAQKYTWESKAKHLVRRYRQLLEASG